MPSNTPLTDAINALTQYANETTGASDTTLSAAVGTLVAGYGGGGGISLDDYASGVSPSGAVVFNGTKIIDRAFIGRTAITSVSGTTPQIGGSAFEGCTYLTSASFPNAATVGGAAFSGCSRLKTLSLPSMTAKVTYLVYNCQQLETVDLSNVTGIGGNYFQQCYALQLVDLPKVTSIDNNAFYNARVLKTLILRHTSVVTLNNAAAFTNTPMQGYNSQSGTIYVPQSLISSYQSAAQWSTLYNGGHCTFTAIEGSQYE